VRGAAAWLCSNSRLGYPGVTTCSGAKAVAGILRSQRGAEVVMATMLLGWCSLLGTGLCEQDCLVSSSSKCGSIDDGV